MKNQLFDIALSNSLEWTVNGKPVGEDVGEHLVERTSMGIDTWNNNRCSFCNTQFTSQRFSDVADDNDTWHKDRQYAFLFCQNCAYWQFNGIECGNKCMDVQTAVLLSSISARFNKELPPVCSQELAQHLRRHPSYWHEIKPSKLEKLVADVFRANYSDSEVIHVGKPYDEGIDVIFIESNGKRWLIQVKRREKAKPSEGFSTLQSILGTLALDGCQNGIIVTTANSFSYHAQKAKKRAEQQGFTVQLIDKGVLNRMISPLLPSTPWDKIFSSSELSHISIDVQNYFTNIKDRNQLFFKDL